MKQKLFLIVSLFYILYTIFPAFADLISIPAWLPSLLSVAIFAILYPSAFKNKCFYWFCGYAAVLAIYVILSKPLTVGIGTAVDSKKIFIEYAYLLPAISIFGILALLDDKELNRKLVKWSVIILFVSFIIEVPLMRQYGSIREALSEQGEDLNIFGLPGYSLMHAYTLMIPAACYAVRVTEKRNKLIALVALCILAFVVYNTFVTTSLFLMIAGIFFSFAYDGKNTRTLLGIIIPLFLFVYLLSSTGFFIKFINWVMPAFEGTPVEGKLLDIQQSMIVGHIEGGTLTGRQNLHGISWQAFWHNPIFGSEDVGGHSALIDRLGGMGLFAFIPFIMMNISAIKILKFSFSTQLAQTIYMVGVIMGLMFMYTKGLWGCEAWLMYFVLFPYTINVMEDKLNK